MNTYFKQLKWTILQSYLFYSLYALTSSLFPLISQLLFDQRHKGLAFLGFIGLTFLLLIALNLVMEYCNRVWEWKISKNLALLLKSDLFQRFIGQDHQTFEQQRPIDYVSIITNHVEVVSEDYFSVTIDLGKSLLKLLIFCISMTYVLNWQLTLVILGFSLVTSYLPNLTQKTLAKLRKKDLTYQKDYNHKLLDLLSGYQYVSSQTMDVFKREHQTESYWGYAKTAYSLGILFGGFIIFRISERVLKHKWQNITFSLVAMVLVTILILLLPNAIIFLI
ncbi:ABC-type multidrug transport system fused ATPase/permease subunit [Streptococcus rupicaprae]|uniref:ABC-type multidrug transport system fused ATPase/permease subunit n=2 Tax=Streptococcus rupicaprae TaxID=759619 RepID=A0ABV2FEQ5_9STRE